ncbi:hypothetical protein L596_010495 [Steinernema carpocapsae]|uniref:Uncharacterized protein n=1 Tax=Steinernema carpocapsae TaxID=34508 RepID=A0A4V6A705_STECR|nr:hypothetical protein L596_010495 [Steinernema carpocapsae]
MRDAEPVNAQSISDEFNYCGAVTGRDKDASVQRRYFGMDELDDVVRRNAYNQTIPDIIKFNKLLLYVSGEAKDIIKRYIVTADNFEIAYAALKAYYGNEVRIGNELHKQLRTIAPPANDVKSLRRFMNDIASITAQMMAMHVPSNDLDTTHAILRKLPDFVRRKTIIKYLKTECTMWTW